jgi:hypothetical protein
LTSNSIEKAKRAKMLREEFLAPIMGDIRKGYADRIVHVASTELDPKAREQKLTSLSVAMKILDNIEHGMTAIIEDGKVAERELVRAEKVERMSAPAKRLFNVIPY